MHITVDIVNAGNDFTQSWIYLATTIPRLYTHGNPAGNSFFR